MAAPRDDTPVRLSQAAPWNPALTNPYRTRYAQHAGRYFRIESGALNEPWFVWEITAAGELLDASETVLCSTLAQSRQAILDLCSEHA